MRLPVQSLPIAVVKIIDLFAARAPGRAVGPGVPAGPNRKSVPARRPAPTGSEGATPNRTLLLAISMNPDAVAGRRICGEENALRFCLYPDQSARRAAVVLMRINVSTLISRVNSMTVALTLCLPKGSSWFSDSVDYLQEPNEGLPPSPALSVARYFFCLWN